MWRLFDRMNIVIEESAFLQKDWNISYVLPPLQRLKGSVRVGITRIYFMFIDVFREV